MVQLIVPGEPCGKGRPRFVRSTGHAFTPKKTENAQATIKAIWAQAYPGFVPLDCALQMTIIAYMGIPSSASGKRKVSMLNQEAWPMRKPDADNILKLCADALNGL